VLVTILRAGGLAPFVRRTELDSAVLLPDAAATLRELAGALTADPRTPVAPAPDELRYELTVDELTMHATEQTLSEGERRLIAFVDCCPERLDSVEPL
jgi:hypothetical protein